MKNKTAPLNFSNVCNIRAYLAISVQDAIKSRRETIKYWGVTSGIVKMSNAGLREKISAYRAAQNIEIKF